MQNQVQVIPTNSAGLQTIASGSGLSAEQALMLKLLWQERGLDPANPATYTPASIKAGDVDIVLTGDGETTTTATQQ